MPQTSTFKDRIKRSPLAAPLTLVRMATAGYGGYPGKWNNEDDQIQDILNTIRDVGYCMLPDYYSAQHCSALRDEIDGLLETHKDSVSFDDLIGDARLFGAEKVSETIKDFNRDPRLQKLSNLYHGEHAPAPFTMAARLEPNDINENKDHGWHRDSLRRQFKAIIYLDDTYEDNGPFQYITQSHHKRNIFMDGMHGSIPYMSAAVHPQSAKKIIARNPERLKTVTGQAGTLILADTTGIHRGSTIKSGKRYALTNYYMYQDSVGPHLNDYFGPMAYAQ